MQKKFHDSEKNANNICEKGKTPGECRAKKS